MTIQKYDWVSKDTKLNANGWSVTLKHTIMYVGMCDFKIENLQDDWIQQAGPATNRLDLHFFQQGNISIHSSVDCPLVDVNVCVLSLHWANVKL